MTRDDDDEESGIFAGQTFYLLGTISGYTKSKVASVIEEEGGTVTEDYTDDAVSRIIVSPILWGQEGTVGASLVLKNVRAANLANAEASVEAERDPDEHRVWLLSFDWVLDSVRAGMMLDDEDFDWEKQKDSMRAKKAKEAADERKRNGGFSKYRPGERARKMREQEEKAEIREMEREVAREKQDAEKKLRMDKEAKEKEDARRAANPQAAVVIPEMPPMPEPLDLSALSPIANTTTSSSAVPSYQSSSQRYHGLPPLVHRPPAAQSTSNAQARTNLQGRKFGSKKYQRPQKFIKSAVPNSAQRAAASGSVSFSGNGVDASTKPTASNACDAKKPFLNVKPVDMLKGARAGGPSTGATWGSNHVPSKSSMSFAAKPNSSSQAPAKPNSSSSIPSKPNSSTQVPAKAKERSSTMQSIVLSDSSDSDVPVARRPSSTLPLKRKFSQPKLKSSSSEFLVISDSDDGPTPKKART